MTAPAASIVLVVVLIVAVACAATPPATGGATDATSPPPGSAGPTAPAASDDNEGLGRVELSGTFGGEAQLEGGCAWVDADDGVRYEVLYPDGWQVAFDPVRLVDPDGNAVAEDGDRLDLVGAVDEDLVSICQVGPIFRATEVRAAGSGRAPPEVLAPLHPDPGPPEPPLLAARVVDAPAASTPAGGVAVVGTVPVAATNEPATVVPPDGSLGSADPLRRPPPSGGGLEADLVGRFGGNAHLEGGCAWLTTADGWRYEVLYPDGWHVLFEPLRLVDPGGTVVATEGSSIGVVGAVAHDAISICQVGQIFRASEVRTPS